MDFEGRLELTAATLERDTLRRRYEEVVGTSAELEAYVEMNAVATRVSALERYLAWSEESPLSGEANPAEEELESYVWAVR
jgi:hypothetical protein